MKSNKRNQQGLKPDPLPRVPMSHREEGKRA
jgi:hypothetical protein